MKVRYPGPAPSVQIPALGNVTVVKGETVEVPDEIGQSLKDQGWTTPTKRKASKAKE